jgi:SAM-dependent methyltransferase
MNNVSVRDPARSGRWAPYLARYRGGEWRDRIFHDVILEDAAALGDDLTFVDIGCGRGLDDSLPLQQSLAAHAGRYVGVEPDPEVQPGTHFSALHRCVFEQAPLPPDSVDVAFAVMVLEHLAEPRRFWDKLHQVLRPGGVFWGLTVDGRHWVSCASYWTERLRVKDLYLNLILGQRGEERYLNYPVYYRSNTPRQIARYVRRFRSCDLLNFARVGQCNPYYPRFIHPLANLFDRGAIGLGMPGTLLAVRVVK